MSNDYQYPLGKNHPELLYGATGVRLEEITLETILEGHVNSKDLSISSETLLMQAIIAENAGYPQLALNFRCAAELVHVPEEQILRIYTALRPRRSTYSALQRLADEIETTYEADRVAEIIREAAEAYEATGMCLVEE